MTAWQGAEPLLCQLMSAVRIVSTCMSGNMAPAGTVHLQQLPMYSLITSALSPDPYSYCAGVSTWPVSATQWVRILGLPCAQPRPKYQMMCSVHPGATIGCLPTLSQSGAATFPQACRREMPNTT